MKKVILISGGNDGLGKATAQKLNTANTIIILGKDIKKTEVTAKEIGCDFVVADISNSSDVERVVKEVVEKYKTIDCLINNAGVWIEGFVENNSYEDISHVIDINTKGTIFLTKAVIPVMKNQKSGRIINVISQAGLHVKGERAVYHASKWALTGFTNSLRMELASFNVSVCGYYPGAMKTNFFEKAGITKDMNKHMELSEAVRALQFIIETSDSMTIPELGIKLTAY